MVIGLLLAEIFMFESVNAWMPAQLLSFGSGEIKNTACRNRKAVMQTGQIIKVRDLADTLVNNYFFWCISHHVRGAIDKFAELLYY